MFEDLTLELSESMPTLPGLPGFEARTLRTHEEHGYLARAFSTKAHQGTHVDAPAHYVPGGRTVDELALAELCGTASVFDLRAASGAAITASDLDAARPDRLHDRVVLVTGDVDAMFAEGTYFQSAAHLTAGAAEWLLECDVSLVALDHLTDDPENPDRPVHHALLGADVPIVEYLANTGRLVEHDRIELRCLPLALAGFEAAPVRAVRLRSSATTGDETARR